MWYLHSFKLFVVLSSVCMKFAWFYNTTCERDEKAECLNTEEIDASFRKTEDAENCNLNVNDVAIGEMVLKKSPHPCIPESLHYKLNPLLSIYSLCSLWWRVTWESSFSLFVGLSQSGFWDPSTILVYICGKRSTTVCLRDYFKLSEISPASDRPKLTKINCTKMFLPSLPFLWKKSLKVNRDSLR